jgi:hypothetical protein
VRDDNLQKSTLYEIKFKAKAEEKQMIPDFSGDFLNYEATEDGDIVEIVSDEGKVEYNEALKKEIYNIKVSHNGKVKTYSPTNKAGKSLQEAFGKDDKNWKGKKFQVVHFDKKMAIRPIKT